MKVVPRFMRVPFRNALKLALCEVARSRNEVDQGWKLFFMFPRNFGGGNISRALARFEAFSRGEWIQLVVASEIDV